VKEVVVYRDRINEIERIIEKPIWREKVVEVEKIVEVIKEVDRLVKDDSDNDCMSQARFIDIWNRMFHLKGIASSQCLSEDDFVGLISRSLMSNADAITEGHSTMYTSMSKFSKS